MELQSRPLVGSAEGNVFGFVIRSRVRQDIAAHVPIHIAGSGG